MMEGEPFAQVPAAEPGVPEAELPRTFGSVSYWLRRAAGVPVGEDGLFDKRRKEIHRYTIADVNGPLTLTVPIVKPHGKAYARWSDVALSSHGEWWHVHRTALESAYGRTPFFEFYIDRFAPFVSPEAVGRFRSILDYNRAIDAQIEELLLLPITAASNGACGPVTAASFSKAGFLPLPGFPGELCEPYWQPRAAQLGFIPDLSVLDLLFCLGPEAALWIRRALKRISVPTAPASPTLQ